MIRKISSYSIKILKDDIKYLEDDQFALLVYTTDLATAHKLHELLDHLNKIGWIYDKLTEGDTERHFIKQMLGSDSMVSDNTCQTKTLQ